MKNLPRYAEWFSDLPETLQPIMVAATRRTRPAPEMSLMMQLLRDNLTDCGAPPPNYSLQAAASQMGNSLEEYVAAVARSDDAVTGSVYLGRTIIDRLRACGDDTDEFDAVVARFGLDPERAREIVSRTGRGSASMPDVVVIDRDDDGQVSTVSCAEIKASGNNDSSAVPKNLDKLRFDTKNSAVSPWRHMDPEKVRRAVWIAAAEPGDRNLSRWRIAAASDTPDVRVVASGDGYRWLTGADRPDYDRIPEMVAWSKTLDLLMDADEQL